MVTFSVILRFPVICENYGSLSTHNFISSSFPEVYNSQYTDVYLLLPIKGHLEASLVTASNTTVFDAGTKTILTGYKHSLTISLPPPLILRDRYYGNRLRTWYYRVRRRNSQPFAIFLCHLPEQISNTLYMHQQHI